MSPNGQVNLIVMGKTGLNVAHLKEQLVKIMNEDGLSPEEVSQVANISKTTLYRILNVETLFAQRAVGRKIAEGTGRTFKIEGDKIYFSKKGTEVKVDENADLLKIAENIKLRPDMQEIYDLLMRMPEKKRESILEFLKGMVDDLD